MWQRCGKSCGGNRCGKYGKDGGKDVATPFHLIEHEINEVT